MEGIVYRSDARGSADAKSMGAQVRGLGGAQWANARGEVMATPRFDVDDAKRRESFLRHALPDAISKLGDGSTARWGRMRPQEMVEHLIWAFRLSTGQACTDCYVPAADLPRMKQFMYSNGPTPREFVNPALAAGLPPLEFGSLAEAKAALRGEVLRFLDGFGSAQDLYTHPLFGPIGYDEWHRTHYKHTHHHLLQFGLIEPA